MSHFWNPLIKQLTPYEPGEQPQNIQDLVKLNTNENPYPPSPKVFEALSKGINESLRLYPDPNSTHLKKAIATYHQVKSDWVFVGNGSDEVLAHTFLALLKHDAPVLFPDVTYSFYPVYCNLYQIDAIEIPLTQDFRIKPEDYQLSNGGIIFPNPNAPTGNLLPLKEIEQILKLNQNSVVVIDEAYIDFGGQSAIKLTQRYPNLLIIRTFSKSRSLAGIRLGYAIGHPLLIEALERVKNSFNSYPIDRLTELAGIASLQDERYFQEQCLRIIQQRTSLMKNLSLLGFKTLPSSANFILASPPEPFQAKLLANDFKKYGIIVRYFNHPRLQNFLRISIGTERENKELIQVIKECIGFSENI